MGDPAPALWLIGAGGVSLLRRGGDGFDRDAHARSAEQTERLLRTARLEAAGKANRGVGGGGRARDAESDLQTPYEAAMALHGGKGPPHWREPAEALGVPLAKAEAIYGADVARRLFSMADPDTLGLRPIGRRDAFGVAYAPPHKLAEAKAALRVRSATAKTPHHVSQTLARMARRRVRSEEGQ